MNKRGRVNKDYQPRFFRTTEDASGRRVLAYYKTPYDTKPQGEAFVIDELKIFNGDLEVNPKLAPMVIGSLSSEDEKDKSPSASSSSSSSPSTPPRSSRPSSPTGDGETGTAGSGEGDVSPGLAVSTVFRPSFKTSSNFAPSMFYDPKVGLASTEFTVQSLGRSLCLRAAAVCFIFYSILACSLSAHFLHLLAAAPGTFCMVCIFQHISTPIHALLPPSPSPAGS